MNENLRAIKSSFFRRRKNYSPLQQGWNKPLMLKFQMQLYRANYQIFNQTFDMAPIAVLKFKFFTLQRGKMAKVAITTFRYVVWFSNSSRFYQFPRYIRILRYKIEAGSKSNRIFEIHDQENANLSVCSIPFHLQFQSRWFVLPSPPPFALRRGRKLLQRWRSSFSPC